MLHLPVKQRHYQTPGQASEQPERKQRTTQTHANHPETVAAADGRWAVAVADAVAGGSAQRDSWFGVFLPFFSGKSKAKGKSKGKSKGKAESIKELDAGYPESPRQRYFDVLIFSQSKDL